MEGSSKNNSTTKAKPAKREAENAEDRNRKSKRARRIKTEAAGRGTVTSTNDDHTAATISLSELPVDVLIKIVKMLPMAQWASLESVNVHFRRAAFEAWRSVRKIHLDEDFVFKNRDGVDEENGEGGLDCLLEKLVARSPNINEISGFASIGPIAPKQRNQCFHLLGQFQSLERVSFAHWKDHEDDVARFFRQADNLGKFKEVDFSGLYFKGADILRTDAMGSIAQGNDSLKLEKFWRRDASAGWLTLASVSLTTLSVVDTDVSPEDLLALVNRNDRLERLEFSVVSGPEPDEAKMAVAYTQLFSAVAALTSKNLSVLKIGRPYFCFWPSLHSELAHLLEECGRCRRLKELSLTQWDVCTTGIVDAIAYNLTHLMSLSMTIADDCDSASLINLMTKLMRLQKLKIRMRDFVLDGAVVAAVATNLIELESLELFFRILPPVNLKNLGLLTNLKKLHIDAGRIDNDVLKAWSGGFGSTLESLTLSHQPRKGFLHGFSTLIKGASKLRRLDLDYVRFTDRHLQLIASSCPLLREFYAREEKRGITKLGIQAIIDGCHQLKWLEIPVNTAKYPPPWNIEQLNVGRYRKINFCRRQTKAPFGKDG